VVDATCPKVKRAQLLIAEQADAGRRLLGAISLRELLVAPDTAAVETLMTADPVTVHPETDLEDVGKLFVKYAFRAIPVVDADQKLVGAVRLKTIVSERAHLLKES
jgi:Mg/Co/Ni transporter MgtE